MDGFMLKFTITDTPAGRVNVKLESFDVGGHSVPLGNLKEHVTPAVEMAASLFAEIGRMAGYTFHPVSDEAPGND